MILNCYLNQKNNDLLEEEITFEVKNYHNKFVILVDTDLMMDYFEEKEAQHQFFGAIEIAIKQDSFNRDQNMIYKFSFEFDIKFINPKIKSHIANDVASIDFGTSSTCVAINRGRDLVAFSDENDEKNDDFENMTALIIYKWKDIYKAWQHSNPTMPHMKRSKNRANKVTINDHYDYSQNVKKELINQPSPKTIEAIITKLKSLPNQLEKDRINKPSIKPFDKEYKKLVYLTDDINEENEETLNPIALYGYLIGRSLNLQVKDKVYTKYRVTFPVKFNNYQREAIINSLRFGVRRALPKTLQDDLDFEKGYEESVALLGVAKKLGFFKQTNPKKRAVLFAVFDFGGGTLDFAFGLYRKSSSNPEEIIDEYENSKAQNVIEIFKTEGFPLGGEVLIEKLSWQLYKDNRKLMQEEKIPIYQPEDTEPIKNYPDELIRKRHIDYINLATFNEQISREFFINEEENTELELFSIDNDVEPKLITLENFNKEELKSILETEIFNAVNNFKNVLKQSFKKYLDRLELFGYDEFNFKDIKILKAGNTCKSPLVTKAFEKFFVEEERVPQENIINIEDPKRKVTLKNSVARGGLMLNGVFVHNHSLSKNNNDVMPLDRYIWNIDELDDDDMEEVLPVFEQGANPNLEYKKIAIREGNSFVLYYSNISKIDDSWDPNLKSYTISLDEVDDEKFDVYLKPFNGSEVKCVISYRNATQQELEQEKEFIIDLSKGEIING